MLLGAWNEQAGNVRCTQDPIALQLMFTFEQAHTSEVVLTAGMPCSLSTLLPWQKGPLRSRYITGLLKGPGVKWPCIHVFMTVVINWPCRIARIQNSLQLMTALKVLDGLHGRPALFMTPAG